MVLGKLLVEGVLKEELLLTIFLVLYVYFGKIG